MRRHGRSQSGVDRHRTLNGQRGVRDGRLCVASASSHVPRYLDVNIYNANIRYAHVVRLAVEWSGAGGPVASVNIETVRAFDFHTVYDFTRVASEFLVLVAATAYVASCHLLAASAASDHKRRRFAPLLPRSFACSPCRPCALCPSRDARLKAAVWTVAAGCIGIAPGT